MKNKINKLANRLKSNFYNHHVKQLKNQNPKEWWKIVKEISSNTKVNTNEQIKHLAKGINNGNMEHIVNMIKNFFKSTSSNFELIKR
jgi:endonuclease V-like protein UPF0215 family